MRVKRGWIVAIEFSDHVQDGTRSIPFVVYGRVACITRREIALDSWEYRDTKRPHDRNEQRYSIVRSAIHNITRLVPVKEQ